MAANAKTPILDIRVDGSCLRENVEHVAAAMAARHERENGKKLEFLTMERDYVNNCYLVKYKVVDDAEA